MKKIKPIKYIMEDYRKIILADHSWDSDHGSGLKIKIDEHIREVFNGKCFYCQTQLSEGNASGETEHIVHKSKYKSFTYRPENLILSCKQCNTSKSIKNTLSSSLINKVYRYKDYPRNSSDYTIIHAYLDNYNDHILIEDKLFYVAKNGSTKGNETIKLCSLYRLKLAEDKSRELLKELSLAEKFKSNTKEELDKFYEDILDKSLDIYTAENLFENMLSITKSKLVSDLAKYLFNLGNSQDIEYRLIKKSNVALILSCYENRESINFFNELITYLSSNEKLKKQITNFLEKNGMILLSYNDNVQFTVENFCFFKSSLNSNLINIDKRMLPKLKRIINLIDNKKIEKILYFNKKLDILPKMTEITFKILNNKKIIERIKLLSIDKIESLESDLLNLGHYVYKNQQLLIIFKFRLFYALRNIDVSSIKELHKTLLNLNKYK